MKKIIGTLFVGGVLTLIVAISVVKSGVYDVSALTPHSKAAAWLMNATTHASVERRAKAIEVPELTQAMQQAGINDFESMCVGCHGRPGRKPNAMGLGLNPKAPDLAKSGSHLSAAELYWVTKNGIKMTGMPAWGASHGDKELWPVVAFMTELPNLDQLGYETSLANAAGFGHHPVDKPNAHAGEELTEPEPPVEHKPAHDHSTHDH